MENGGKDGDKGAQPTNLAGTPRINSFVLADGKTYELSPVNLNIMTDLEDWDGQGRSYAEIVSKSTSKMLRYLFWLRIKVKHPDLKLEDLGALVTADVLMKIGAQKKAK